MALRPINTAKADLVHLGDTEDRKRWRHPRSPQMLTRIRLARNAKIDTHMLDEEASNFTNGSLIVFSRMVISTIGNMSHDFDLECNGS